MNIQLFEQQQVRSHWDSKQEKWYFSIVDVIGVLTESPSPQAYWRKLKQRLSAEGNETVINCHALKMPAADGKQRLTDVADTELVLNMLAEASAKDISQAVNPETFAQSRQIAQQGGNVAKVARDELEKQTGKSVVSSDNARTLRGLADKPAPDKQNGCSDGLNTKPTGNRQ